MQILVTGKGFLAKHLINFLLSPDGLIKPDRVVCANRSGGVSPNTIKYKNDKYLDVYVPLEISPCVQDLFKYYKPDIVFHLAASQEKTAEGFENNVSATHNLLKHVPNGTKFIYSSSSTVYGDLAQHKLDYLKSVVHETKWDLTIDGPVWKCHEECLTIPTSLYSSGKLSGENILWAYSKIKNLKPLILRFPAIVGKGATHGALRDIVKKTQENDVVELFGKDPGSKKPYLNISDAVETMLLLANSEHTGIFNVSPDDEITIKDMAELVQDHLGVKKELKWIDSPIQWDNNLVALYNRKLLQFYDGFKYKTSAEAVKKAIEDIVK